MTRHLEFDFEWRITLFTICLLPLLISLGFWQLEREQEKQALADDFARKQSQAPVALAELATREPAALAFLPVTLRGRYRPRQSFLLDNRTREGRYGNEVYTVFELLDGTPVLVNRGWTPADPARQRATAIPEIPSLSREYAVTGQIYVSPGKPYLLESQVFSGDWPQTIQALDMGMVADILDEEPFPHPVRIDAGQPGSLQVDWQVINISPAKHRGYAVQWFSMAAVLLLLYLLRSTNIWQLIKGAPDRGTDDE